MGNRYNNQSIQQHHLHQKSIFLPMLCRLSINDINQNNHNNNKDRISTDDPSSPKVSCIGQVKRNNRVAATTAAVSIHHHKNTKLKKVFSGKALLPPSTSIPSITASGGRSGSKSCRASRGVCLNNSRRSKLNNGCDRVNGNRIVNISEMDPPLPVVKKVAPPGVGRDEVNIWKRRFNGPGLKGLQIELVHLPNCKIQFPTTV